jgi:CheY-like chemotaxis protein
MATKESPDVILMDIRLPKINGLDVTKRLRSNPTFAKVPIIAVTAHAMGGDEEKAAEAGCDAYVTKPVDTRRLPEVILEALRRRQDEI